MRNFKYLAVLFVALSVGISCTDDDDDGMVGNPILGSWSLTEAEGEFEFSILATFEENGTGILTATVSIAGESQSESDNFTWSTDADQLTMTMNGETEVSTYSISGDTLSITDDEGLVTELKRE
jgi:uncharacterized lipoprotein NlpE involved in copper resistance